MLLLVMLFYYYFIVHRRRRIRQVLSEKNVTSKLNWKLQVYIKQLNNKKLTSYKLYKLHIHNQFNQSVKSVNCKNPSNFIYIYIIIKVKLLFFYYYYDLPLHSKGLPDVAHSSIIFAIAA
jgi:hypothetical protein